MNWKPKKFFTEKTFDVGFYFAYTDIAFYDGFKSLLRSYNIHKCKLHVCTFHNCTYYTHFYDCLHF